MSWIDELYKTYEKGIIIPEDITKYRNRAIKPLLPLFHQLQKSGLEIIIDSYGQYLGAKIIDDKADQKIIVPCTEQSAARTTNDSPHPLCDKIQYCAKDYQKYIESWLCLIQKLGISKERIIKEFLKNKSKSYYESYYKQQKNWFEDSGNEPMLNAISKFVTEFEIVEHLIKKEIVKNPIFTAFELTFNEEDFEKFNVNNDSIYSIISEEIQLQGYEINSDLKNKIFSNKKKVKVKEGDKTAFNYSVNLAEAIVGIADLLVRWKVYIPNKLETRCWKNRELMDSWVTYSSQNEEASEICFVTGTLKSIARTHPKGIIDTVTNAKLISANDSDGFTFRGRFIEDFQACTVSTEISHKAHSALKWLISRQGYQNGTQTIVSWAVTGEETPDMFADSISLFDEADEDRIIEISHVTPSDAGQTFARKLSKKIAGYKADLSRAKKIVLMGLDSAGPGRISITYYRELSGSDFLERIENWHFQMAWHFLDSIQDPNENKKKHYGYFASAPAPATIAEACYGTKRDKDFVKYKKSMIERLLPCIIEGKPIPVDIVDLAVRKASNRLVFKVEEHWQWERTLSVACALYSCYSIRNIHNIKKIKNMALENERTDRDYLYGRLLAVAEHIEETALRIAKENRDTTASRLMQRFSDYPFSTWRSIELALKPYESRILSAKWGPGFLVNKRKLIDEIHAKFESVEDYKKDSRLTGLYLLGYHCQRLDLAPQKNKEDKESEIENN
jgi:CRISPR-associated protein Csd1